jgi:hypothetical protein
VINIGVNMVYHLAGGIGKRGNIGTYGLSGGIGAMQKIGMS